jgi:hypothetical protein
MNQITIANAGQRILSTNYWDSEQARAGYFFLSWNAGAGRLLVPDSQKPTIREMRSAKYIIVSRGSWTEKNGREAIELLFEDESDSPYCVHLVAEQCDRLIPDYQQGGGFDIIVLTRGGEKLRLPGKYRHVNSIPYLQPWTEQ